MSACVQGIVMSKTSLRLTLTEAQLNQVAEIMAGLLKPGDAVALSGDLGAGKTTFARALIRALSNNRQLDVPSPSFSLRQDYFSAVGPISHFDFYRITEAHEVDELGLDEALASSIVLVEWPERVSSRLPPDRLRLCLSDGRSVTHRLLQVKADGRLAPLVTALQSRVENSDFGSV